MLCQDVSCLRYKFKLNFFPRNVESAELLLYSQFKDVQSYLDHILKTKKPTTQPRIGKRKIDRITPDLNESTGSIYDSNEQPIKSKKGYKRKLPESKVDNLSTQDFESYQNRMERLTIEANENIHFA